MPLSPPTLDQVARETISRFTAAGITPGEARLDAELLLRSVLKWDRAQWFTRDRERAPADLQGRLEPLVVRRAAREPMAYVLGRCEFWGREFEVAPGVLVPRPETEIIVEQALMRIDAGQPVSIVDVGTGSGCLAVTVAAERPQVHVLATDISPRALEVARRNAERHGVSARVTFVGTSLMGEVAVADLVVSNPPYVPEGDRGTLSPEVVNYEPAEALFAGTDGLDVVRPLVAEAANRLRVGGWLLFEFGMGQDGAVRRLLDDGRAWREVVIARDLQGIPRTAIARRA